MHRHRTSPCCRSSPLVRGERRREAEEGVRSSIRGVERARADVGAEEGWQRLRVWWGGAVALYTREGEGAVVGWWADFGC
jgi:hypothetical protein